MTAVIAARVPAVMAMAIPMAMTVSVIAYAIVIPIYI